MIELARSLLGLIAVGVACLLAGCGSLPIIPAMKGDNGLRPVSAATVEDRGRGAILEYVGSANPAGATDAIIDPTTGKSTQVTVESVYFAASGRNCRRYTLSGEARPHRGLACQNEDGRWVSRRVLVDSTISGG